MEPTTIVGVGTPGPLFAQGPRGVVYRLMPPTRRRHEFGEKPVHDRALLSARPLFAESRDFRRSQHPCELFACLGLVPGGPRQTVTNEWQKPRNARSDSAVARARPAPQPIMLTRVFRVADPDLCLNDSGSR